MNVEEQSIAPHKRTSLGFDCLCSGLSSLSPAAQDELFDLLGPEITAKKMKQTTTPCNTSTQSNENTSKIHRQIVTASTTETEMLSMVLKSKVSLLGSICYMFVEEHTSSNQDNNSSRIQRNAMEILKRCGFVVDPHRSPGQFDARAMVLAALSFLCGTSYLRPVSKATSTGAKASADISKRFYEKGYDWDWDDVKQKLTGEVEDAFYDDDPRNYQFLSRQRFLPAPSFFAGSKRDRFQLLLRGALPIQTQQVATMHVAKNQSSQDCDNYNI